MIKVVVLVVLVLLCNTIDSYNVRSTIRSSTSRMMVMKSSSSSPKAITSSVLASLLLFNTAPIPFISSTNDVVAGN